MSTSPGIHASRATVASMSSAVSTRDQRRDSAPAVRRGSLPPRRGARAGGAPDASCQRGDQPREGDGARLPRAIAHCHRDGTARDGNESEVAPRRDRSRGGRVSRRCRQGTGRARPRRGGGERATPSPVFGLEVGDARVDDEPVRRSSRVEVTPHGPSVGAGVGRPAGGLDLPSEAWRSWRRGSPAPPGARTTRPDRRPPAATAAQAAGRDTHPAR